MDCRDYITRDPALLAGQARDVLDHVNESNSHADPACTGLHKFLGIVFDNLVSAMHAVERDATPDEKLEAAEACSIDLLQAIGLLKAIIGDDSDSPALDGVLTLLMLSKIEIDDLTSRIMHAPCTAQAHETGPEAKTGGSRNGAPQSPEAPESATTDNSVRHPLQAIQHLAALLGSLRAAQALDEGGSPCWRVIGHALLAYEPVMERLRAGDRDGAMYACAEGESLAQAAAALAASPAYRPYSSPELAEALAIAYAGLDKFSNDLDIGGRFHPQEPTPQPAKPARIRKAVPA
ncbi:hypothetical protein [uncultured Hydrogenophaga sp.]|uniref:hypothetical protein n=1 Tax=uncultured Hydrogenophaga sp. TaxID=199683 RepID=UPI00258302AB|nr:hypothetical protein [uncultured Hydrogenophaga sp.]